MRPYRYLYDADKDTEIYDKLRRLLIRNDRNLILFAGSGLTAQASTDDGDHPPVWKDLLEEMTQWCSDRDLIGSQDLPEMQQLIDEGFLIEAGQELQELLEPSDLQRCLGDVLLINSARPSEAHTLVVQIPFRAYLTTNYDDFIEGEFWRKHGLRLQKFYESTVQSILEAYREAETFIFKLHGDINSPHSIVLGNRSYERLLYRNPDYRNCLETIFATSSVLFVGFGGNDPDLDNLTSQVSAFDGRSKRHWMVVPRGSFPALKAKRLWRDKGIHVIEYEPGVNHSGLIQFLRRLAQPPPLVSAN